MKRTNFFFATLTFCTFAVLAQPIVNAGTPVDSKMVSTAKVEEPFNWTGFYLGLNVGGVFTAYDFDKFSTDVDIGSQYNEVPRDGLTLDPTFVTFDSPKTKTTTRGVGKNSAFNPDRNGTVTGGGQVGYNFQFGHFVFGVEGDFDRQATSGGALFRDSTTSSLNDATIDATTDYRAVRRAQTNWTASARARFGYAQGAWLFYVTGGVAWAGVDTWATDTASTTFTDAGKPRGAAAGNIGTITDSSLIQRDETWTGWTAGAGLEVAVSDALTLGVEYRHNDFGDQNTASANKTPIFSSPSNLSLYSDQLTVRLNVQMSHLFGHDRYVTTEISSKDKNAVPVAPAEAFNWSGFYLGANVGGIWNDYDFGATDTTRDLGIAGGSPGAGDIVHSGTPAIDGRTSASILGGGQAGYQYEFGHFVAGVEGDFGGMISSSQTDFNSGSQLGEDVFTEDAINDFRVRRRAETGWQASVRGKLGWAPGQGRIMLYATGGVAWADLKVTGLDVVTTQFTDGDVVTFVDTLRTGKRRQGQIDSQMATGGTVGGGIDYAMSEIVSVGAEYRHNFFGEETFRYHNTGSLQPGSTTVNLDSDQVTLRVNFLLGHMGH